MIILSASLVTIMLQYTDIWIQYKVPTFACASQGFSNWPMVPAVNVLLTLQIASPATATQIVLHVTLVSSQKMDFACVRPIPI